MGSIINPIRRITAHSADARDMFVCGLDRIDQLAGGCLRFVLFVEHSAEEGGAIHRLPAPRNLIIPAAAVPDVIGKAMMAVARQVVVRADGSLTVTH